MSKNTWVRVYQYAKKHGVKSQSVYRWIREGKIDKDNWRQIEVVVSRKEISEDTPLPKNRKTH